jgi:hypothetical protein
MDLTLVNSDDMVEELLNRFDASFFMGVIKRDKASSNYKVRFNGDMATLRGLNAMLGDYLIDCTEDIIGEPDI